MMTVIFLLFLAGYALNRAATYAKNNPAQSLQAANWLRQMFFK